MPFSPAARGLLCSVGVALALVPLIADEPEFCVAGTVLNAITGEPLRRAAVTIPQSAALTDAAGAFRFCNLPAGAYFANAEKPGFTAAGSRAVVGPSREDVVLQLHPLGVITGAVVDADGEPLQNALIQALSTQVLEGRRKVRLESAVSTDDRGEYRLAGLTAGRYYLRAAGWEGAPPDLNEAFAPVYYGGGSELASAAPVTVEPGRDLRADFSVSLRTAYKIHGAIAGFSPLTPAKIELLGADAEPSGIPVTLDTATGKFRIDDVAPGSYILRATQGEGHQRSRGELALQIAADVSAAVVPLAGSVALKGIVRMAAATEPTAPPSPNCAVKLSPVEAWISGEAALEAPTELTGEFEIEDVLPGRYRLRMDCASGYISAARMGDTDLLESAELLLSPGAAQPRIEAVLASDGGTVEVTASADGEGVPAWVLLLPGSGNVLHTKFARLARLADKLTFTGVAPGDYQAYAWTGSPEAFEYANPDARQGWSARAVSVHIGARERQSLTLKIAAGDAP
jgi:hypothetical protein